MAEDDSNADRQHGFKVLRRRLKGSKESVIPDVHTYHATEVCERRALFTMKALTLYDRTR